MECKGEPTTLYRIFTQPVPGEFFLLYVGVSVSWTRRLQQHQGSADWGGDIHRVDLEHHCCRRHAEQAEAEAIATEHPAYNRSATTGRFGGVL